MIGLVNRLKVWTLVHEDGLPAKAAAARLGIPISNVYDLLAEERSRRDIAAHRAAALGMVNVSE